MTAFLTHFFKTLIGSFVCFIVVCLYGLLEPEVFLVENSVLVVLLTLCSFSFLYIQHNFETLKHYFFFKHSFFFMGLITFCILFLLNTSLKNQQRHFSESLWKSDYYKRQLIVDDLTHHYLTTELTIEDVAVSLGVPTQKIRLSHSTDWTYAIFSNKNLSGPSAFLVLNFDSQHRLLHWQVNTLP